MTYRNLKLFSLQLSAPCSTSGGEINDIYLKSLAKCVWILRNSVYISQYKDRVIYRCLLQIPKPLAFLSRRYLSLKSVFLCLPRGITITMLLFVCFFCCFFILVNWHTTILRPAQLWDWHIFSLLHQDVFTEQTLANLFIELWIYK